MRRVAILIFLTIAQCAALFLLVWRPTVEAALPSYDIAAFEVEKPESSPLIWFLGGSHYYVATPRLHVPGYRLLSGDDANPKQSTLQLLRDGQPLGPAHTVEWTIRTGIYGNGAHAHWDGKLYFTTVGNADPRTDGAVYSVKARLAIHPLFVGVLAGLILGTLPLSLLLLNRMQVRSWPVILAAVKFGALAYLLVVIHASWSERFLEQFAQLRVNGDNWLAAGYVVVSLIAVVAICAIPFLGHWSVRALFALPALVAIGFDQVIIALSAQPVSLDLMKILWRERAMSGTVLTAYQEAIAKGLLAVAPLVPAFLLPVPHALALRLLHVTMPLVALPATFAALVLSNGMLAFFPPAFDVPAKLLMAQMPSQPSNVQREPVRYEKPFGRKVRKIVMVVDESVRGDYIGLNNSRFNNTPFLTKSAGDLANFGVAAAISNCSDSARAILRLGLQRRDLPDLRNAWVRKPSIWQYAKAAGYRTVLIDGWQVDRPFHSYLEIQERKEIDQGLWPKDRRHYMRDMEAVEFVARALEGDEPTFIYLNKYGTHIDYQFTFPNDIQYDATEIVAALPLDPRRRAIVNNYHKALNWSVDAFFERMLPLITARDDTALIYTSDHGQALFEGGYDASHCTHSPDLARGEVKVPLFVATRAAPWAEPLRRHADLTRDKASHLEIFPTLLEFMGYNDDWVQVTYGPSLRNFPPNRPRGFLLGIFFRPGTFWVPY